jgi:4-cresol dehydrogenase (hydroxylating)
VSEDLKFITRRAEGHRRETASQLHSPDFWRMHMRCETTAAACSGLLNRWKQLLDDAAVFGPALDATLADVGEFRRRRVLALLRPHTPEQVRAVVAAAAECGGAVPLYPFSTGRNWGLGSRQPTADGCALLDLGRLRRVRQLDLERGYAIVEPGVTQRQLSRLLEGTSRMLNVTGSCADTSVLGNALDRGIGFARQRTGDLLALEVVLANGEQIRVGGFWHAPGDAPRTFHYRHGIGPDLLPLFCQSNLGVVTAGVVSLLPRPESVRVFQGRFPEAALDRTLELLRELHRDGLLNNVSKIYNAAAMETYGLGGGEGYLFTGAFSGRSSIADAVTETVREEIRRAEPSAEVLAFDADEAERVPGADRFLADSFGGRTPACPGIERLFRTRGCDIDRAGAEGWLMFLPVVPFEPGAVRRALALSEAIARDEGLRRNATLNLLDASCVDMVMTLRFPRTADGIRRAHTAFDRLHRTFATEGFFLYRADIEHQDAEVLYGVGPYHDTLRKLKTPLDPQGIIAPGRYLPQV